MDSHDNKENETKLISLDDNKDISVDSLNVSSKRNSEDDMSLELNQSVGPALATSSETDLTPRSLIEPPQPSANIKALEELSHDIASEVMAAVRQVEDEQKPIWQQDSPCENLAPQLVEDKSDDHERATHHTEVPALAQVLEVEELETAAERPQHQPSEENLIETEQEIQAEQDIPAEPTEDIQGLISEAATHTKQPKQDRFEVIEHEIVTNELQLEPQASGELDKENIDEDRTRDISADKEEEQVDADFKIVTTETQKPQTYCNVLSQTIASENSFSDTFASTRNNMEFSKNFPGDLLGENEAGQSSISAAGPGGDLADFELPQRSGSSSSGSERAAGASGDGKRGSFGPRKSSSPTQASSSQVCLGPPDFTAVKNLLAMGYTRNSHIFHWEKPIESAIVFSIGASLITAYAFFSIISVVAYTGLGITLAAGLMRVYKVAMATFNMSQETPFDHTWNKILSLDLSISPEKLHELVDSSYIHLNASLVYFKQALLVQDKFAAIKFAIILYLLTYIGAWFTGLTILAITYLALFTLPIFYQKNKSKIDEYSNLAKSQLSSVTSMVTSKAMSVIGGSSQAEKKKN